MPKPQYHTTTNAAQQALQRGFTPIPLRASKKPLGRGWQDTRWKSDQDPAMIRKFEKAYEDGHTNIGLLCGAPSGGLIDVDIDHPIAERLNGLLPMTRMRSGHEARPNTHYWYQVDEELPTKKYSLPSCTTSKSSMIVELRSTGCQTVIPPSIHPSGSEYEWVGEDWGGEAGPSKVLAAKLHSQVLIMAAIVTLADGWPEQGLRHEAFLALAGGLIRRPGGGVSKFWSQYAKGIIEGVARMTGDEDGASTRSSESVGSTIERLKHGKPAAGYGKLAQIIPQEYVDSFRLIVQELGEVAGISEDEIPSLALVRQPDIPEEEEEGEEVDEDNLKEPEAPNPLEQRKTTWSRLDLTAYLAGQVEVPDAKVLKRNDGKGLFYEGRVNLLYGPSEAAKSWISLYTCSQVMDEGNTAMYIDLEDEPVSTISRLQAIGVPDEDLLNNYAYLRPESPIAPMMRGKYGAHPTEDSARSYEDFVKLLVEFDPSLIIIDGMTVLYGLHGLDTNDAMSTDVITTWLKSLTRGGRTTVIVIDHTGKNSGPGASPIGAHHKIAMVQGAAYRANPLERPMPGQLGQVSLTVYKDRPGAVRARSTKGGDEQIAGIVHLDSREQGKTNMWVEAPEEGDVAIDLTEPSNTDPLHRTSVDLSSRVLSLFLTEAASMTVKDAALQLDAPRDKVREAFQFLAACDKVKALGAGRNRVWIMTDLGREEWKKALHV